MAAAAAPAPARLNAAGEAALKAEFGKAYDGVRLRASLQTALVAHFAGKGVGLTDVKDMLLSLLFSVVVVVSRECVYPSKFVFDPTMPSYVP